MQAGLSLRVSQLPDPAAAAIDPAAAALVLEMEQEVEHMLGDNPFLERDEADSSNDNNDSTSNDSAQPPTSAPDSRAEEPLDAIDSELLAQTRKGLEPNLMLFHRLGGRGQLRRCRWPGGRRRHREPVCPQQRQRTGQATAAKLAFERVAQHESLAEHLHRQAWPCAWGLPTAQRCIS